jgi:uncharacterized protein YacL
VNPVPPTTPARDEPARRGAVLDDDARSEGGLDALTQVGHDPAEAAERQRRALVKIVRIAFVVLTITVTLLYVLGEGPGSASSTLNWPLTLLAGVIVAAVAIAVDVLTPRKKISTIFSIVLGLLGAILATVAIGFIMDLVISAWIPDQQVVDNLQPLMLLIKLLVGVSLSYIAVTTVLQTQDDFRLIIPYVEFAKQLRGVRPLLLDTSALIDARIADLAQTNFIMSPLVIPRFVIAELQLLADSTDALRRARGRRGLEVVSRLQRSGRLDVTIDSTSVPGKAVDQMLVELARRMPATIVTSDSALARVAQIQSVNAVNLNDLAAALRPPAMVGDRLTVRIIKAGEQAGQGVGYLPDGTMVVVEEGQNQIGQSASVVVTGSVQTSAGRLIFARVISDAAPTPRGVSTTSESAPQPAHQPALQLAHQLASQPAPQAPSEPASELASESASSGAEPSASSDPTAASSASDPASPPSPAPSPEPAPSGPSSPAAVEGSASSPDSTRLPQLRGPRRSSPRNPRR